MRQTLPLTISITAALLLSTGCLPGPGGGGGTTPTPTPSPAPDAVYDDPAIAAKWILNDGSRAPYIDAASGTQGALVNVERARGADISNAQYMYVEASGIPDYEVLFTQNTIAALNARPKAATDFAGGATIVSAGQTVEFGEDIGFNSSTSNCLSSGGDGYWPPGPECPRDTQKEAYFPTSPQAGTGDCETGLGPIGYMVNGTSIYDWGDGQSYNNQGVWQNLAPIAEQYDVDVCGGHAAQGDYHHHFYSSCLAQTVGDDGSGHSPVYGYAADGYPVHGPWHATGLLAKSVWAKRDYSANSATGCGVNLQRSCIMLDPYDISKGTQSAAAGPDVNATVTTLSGNQLLANSGYFFQDYYLDSTLLGTSAEYLDAHNGHQHDSYGYHYHLTATAADADLIPAFPFTFGPSFYGNLQSNAVSNCGGLQVGGPTPP